MHVFIVRHGESEANRKGLWTGWMDAPLTEQGREDAKKAGEYLKQFSFDKIYASDLQRAVETAKTAIPGCIPETTELLREISVGNLEGQPLSCLTQEQKNAIPEKGYSEFGGETTGQFRERIGKFMKKLETAGDEKVILFSHGGWLRGFLDIVIGTYLPRKSISCENCAVAVFEYKAETWKLHTWMNLM